MNIIALTMYLVQKKKKNLPPVSLNMYNGDRSNGSIRAAVLSIHSFSHFICVCIPTSLLYDCILLCYYYPPTYLLALSISNDKKISRKMEN